MRTTQLLLQCTLLLLAIGAFRPALNAQVIRCYSDEQHAIRMATEPDVETAEAFEAWIEEAMAQQTAGKIVGGVYQIPVVFHVIHSGEAVGTGTNVSFAAIQSQIDVLNEDFRRMLNSNGYNTHPDGADTQIEFCLAQRRPNGTAFTPGEPGVNRILYSSITTTAPPYATNFIDATIKPWTYNGGTPTANRGWDPGKYMNIWLCDISNGILGYAQFPQSPLGGMGCGAQATATDGVVFLYSSIGKSAVTGFGGSYNEGRTATHEIGHWLGLRHIWGDGGCTVDDFCNDTPEAGAPNYGCPVGINSCTAAPDAGPDMVQNYMDYTDDMCMNIFTNDQKRRMRTVLEGSPLRLSLINSDACVPPNTNDASVTDVFNPKGDHCVGSITPSVQLRNRGSANLTSATISYTIDNGTPVTFAYTGTILPGASATVALPAFTTTLGVHQFKAYSTLPNGAVDPSTTYDTSAIQFVVSNGIMPNYLQDFESAVFPPDIKWTVDNANADCYEWVGASGVSSTGTFSNSIAQLPFYGNGSTSNENLLTPVFTLPCNATAATLKFDVAYRQRVAGSNDRLIVELSQDCGATWTSVYDKQGTALRQNATLTGTNAYYPAVAGDWRNETIDLQPYVTTTSKNIRFRFRGISNNGNNVYIDNIAYEATTPGEINVVQNGTDVLDGGTFSFGSVTANTTSNATFTVQNTGSTNLTITPPATVSGAGFALASTFGATTIPAGGSTTFTLSFTPTAAGAFTGTVSFTTNDCDEGTYNFTLTGTGYASAPVAEFTAVPTTVCAGSSVAFTNLSTNAATYSWSFGASAVPSTSTAANPSVIFNTAGVYPVTLVATNAFGTDTETKTGYITVINGVGATLPITEGFTGTTFPPAGWSIVNPDGSATWARSTLAGYTPTTGNSMLFNNFTISDVGHADEVRMRAASFLGLASAQLTFDVAYAYRNAYYSDALEVLISTDCGQTFQSVYQKGGATLQTRAPLTSAFTPTAAEWRTETINLTPYVGNGNVVVAFRNLAGNGNRLFIDNINLTGVAAAAAPVAGFTGTPTTVCAGQSVTYTNTSTGAVSYAWTFAGGTPATSTAQHPTVTYNTAGTYAVTLVATNPSGSTTATQTNYITVNAIPPTPTITAGGPTTFCTGGNVVLTSSAASGNTWSGGQITPSITATTAGTYTVTTTANGCISAPSAATTVTTTAPPATPTITAGGPTTFCAGGNVTLTSSSATNNVWSNGATTQSITVTASGTYTVSVVMGSCSSAPSAGTTVTVNPAPATPTITASGATTFCAGGSVTLTSSAASGNTWSTGATTQSITVNASGTYTVTVTSGGCSATSAGTTVTVNPLPAIPTITAGGPTTFCSGGNVVLTSSASSGNTWSNSATTQAITVTTGGTYTVTVTNGNGCSRTSTGTAITVNPTPATPTITAGGATTFCAGGNVTLTSSASSGNAWSTGATTPSITVNASGTYAVTVTSAGCSATSAGTTVTVNPLPAVPTITAGGPTTFCSGGNVVLTSSASSGNTWSNGATTPSITVTTGGTYTVTVTNGNGCSATSTGTAVTVNALPTVPTIMAGGPTTFCSGSNVVLTSSAGSGNAWSSGETTSSITVAASGNYSVTVTNGNGCSATSATTPVTVNPLPPTPTITASGPTTFCQGGSVTLTSSASSGNTWNTGQTVASITQSTNDNLSVTVTVNGCSATSAVTSVIVLSTPVIAVGTVTNPSSCGTATGSIQVTGSGSGDLSWSGTAGGTLTGTTLPATIPGLGQGSYTLSFVSSGGCASNAVTQALSDPSAPAAPTITASGATTLCAGETVVLTSSSATGNTWSDGSTGATITVSTAGNYSVVLTDVNGCSATSAVTTVTVNPLPAVSFTSLAQMCVYHAVISLAGTPAGGTFSGNGVSGTLFNPAVAGVGPAALTYVFTDANGCSNTANWTILVESCAGVDEATANGLTVFPNPSAGWVTIDAGTTVIERVEVYDATGRLVRALNETGTTSMVDLTTMANGVYTFRVQTATGEQHVPVVKGN